LNYRESNERFANENHEDGLVCVFAGATSGIGSSTLERMASMLPSATFYVIGRSASHFASQRAKLQTLNPTCEVIFLEAEISLLSEVDRVCKQITAAEKKVDYLYMSPGLMPLNGPQCKKLALSQLSALIKILE
jgi:NADP-dependent 3-hydroxy acid dehydrogenase YdfG